jgi:hypothetical protein
MIITERKLSTKSNRWAPAFGSAGEGAANGECAAVRMLLLNICDALAILETKPQGRILIAKDIRAAMSPRAR